jgi:NAD(P)-dependent dehydrogenase (short-subunit alcohol dehydrogenase family)
VLPVNVVAPYLLTALIERPQRLVYLSSGSHFEGRGDLKDSDWSGRTTGSYADSKLYVTAFAKAVARLWPEVFSNAVDPGWVPTKMGGPGAPDDLRLGHLTQENAPRMTVKRVPGAGHFLPEERPELVAARALELCDGSPLP